MLPSSGSVSAAIADARMRGTVEAIVRAHVQARSPSQAQPGKAKRCAVDKLRKTNSDSDAAPASETMTVAQFFRSAASAEHRHATIATTRHRNVATNTTNNPKTDRATHGRR